MRILLEEGLENRWERHRVNQLALIAGLEAMDLQMFVEKPKDRLVTVTAVKIPAGIDDAKVRDQLLNEFNIEIAGWHWRNEGPDLAARHHGLLQPETVHTATARGARQSSDRSGPSPLARSRRWRSNPQLRKRRRTRSGRELSIFRMIADWPSAD